MGGYFAFLLFVIQSWWFGHVDAEKKRLKLNLEPHLPPSTIRNLLELKFPNPKCSSSIKSLNPVWGPQDENTFILHTIAAKLFDADGLQFILKDFDLISADDPLGSVVIPGSALCGEFQSVMERAINPPEGHEGKNVGYLTIRCRRATPEDAKSLKKKEHKALFEVKTGVFD